MGSDRKKDKDEKNKSSSTREGKDKSRKRHRREEDEEEEVEDDHHKSKTSSRSSSRDKDKDKDKDEDEDKKKKKKKKKDHKHRSKRHKDDNLKDNFQELSKDDYFSKNNEFATWLKEERSVFFSNLSSESARKLFGDFVKEWNDQKLESRYYEGIASGPRSAHNWAFKK